MLILTRNIGEIIVIGDNIHICVLGIKGSHHARLGVTAPKDLTVHRLEVYQRIQDEKKQPLQQEDSVLS